MQTVSACNLASYKCIKYNDCDGSKYFDSRLEGHVIFSFEFIYIKKYLYNMIYIVSNIDQLLKTKYKEK